MVTIKPFKALRPVKEYAALVASPPYDVLNRNEAREVAKQNPQSFLHITKAEIDLDDETDVHSKAVYEMASSNLKSFIEKGILFEDASPCYYIYKLVMNGRAQTGLVCLSSVEDYFDGRIKKHEFTRPEKEKDRIDHILSTKAQTGKVFLACHSQESINLILNNWQAAHLPEYEFTTKDKVAHSIWIIDNEETIKTITQAFKENILATYIADGHHRAASAANVSSQLLGNENAKYFLTVIFPDKDLQIMDYNRVVKDLNGWDEEAFIKQLQQNFNVTKSHTAVKPTQPHEFGMYLNKNWYQLIAKPGTYSLDPIGILDVTILSQLILEPLLAIKDQRTDNRIDFVGGIRGVEELTKRVNSGEMQIAFSLYPVSIQQLFDIADKGEVMPPKSTWFEPKLRDGLLTHLL